MLAYFYYDLLICIFFSTDRPNDVALKYLLSLQKEADGPRSPFEKIFGTEKAPLSLDEWNEGTHYACKIQVFLFFVRLSKLLLIYFNIHLALLARLREAQQEKFRTRFTYSSEDSPPDQSLGSPAYNGYMRQQLRGMSTIRGIPSFRMQTPSSYGFRKLGKNSSVTMAPLPPPNSDNVNPSGRWTPRDDISATRLDKSDTNYSTRMVLKSKRLKETLKRRYRDEFDSFVKSLISEVENVAEVVSAILKLCKQTTLNF